MGLDEERESLRLLLKNSILNGESNSLLILGPRGSGKSLLTKLALHDIENDVSVPKNSYGSQLNIKLVSEPLARPVRNCLS